jgi:hypothetical protein
MKGKSMDTRFRPHAYAPSQLAGTRTYTLHVSLENA